MSPENSFLIKIEIPDAEKKLARFTEGLKATPNLVQKATEDIARILVRHLKIAAPVGTYYDLDGNMYEGGSLRDSIAATTSSTAPSGIRGFFAGITRFLGLSSYATSIDITAASHAKYTLSPGVIAHPIFPREKPFLIFYWPKVEKVIISKGVEHPGYAGTDWDIAALSSAENEIEMTWFEMFRQWRVHLVEQI